MLHFTQGAMRMLLLDTTSSTVVVIAMLFATDIDTMKLLGGGAVAVLLFGKTLDFVKWFLRSRSTAMDGRRLSVGELSVDEWELRASGLIESGFRKALAEHQKVMRDNTLAVQELIATLRESKEHRRGASAGGN